MACELSLVEACNNAVLYVTGPSQAVPIQVEVVCDSLKVELRIHDHTDGFTLPPKKDLPLEESESGRGVFIMQSLMDKVAYLRGAGVNTMVMERLRVESRFPTRNVSLEGYNDLQRKLVESEQIITDMAEELGSCYESLSAIFRCGTELGKTDNLKEFSNALCEDLLKITNSDWFVLRLVPKDEQSLALWAPRNELLLSTLPVKDSTEISSAEARAASTQLDVWFDAEHPLNPADPLTRTHPGCKGMIHPLYFGESLIGTLAVGKSEDKARLTAAQANVVHTFGDFLAIQTVNTRLREQQIHNRLVSHELQIAQNIQRALLPKVLPQLPGFGLSGHCESARQVGGDFYDVVQIDDKSVLLVIADVMGKGIPAAMFAAILRSLLRAVPNLISQPAALLAHVNSLLFEELSDVEMFITAQIVYVDFQARQIVAAGAGHCPFLLMSPLSEDVRLISPDGMPLGILKDASFSSETLPLKKKDRLLLYTDGVTDAQNMAGKFFGQERWIEAFRMAIRESDSASEIKNRLVEDLHKFQQPAALYDDQTFLVLAEETT